LNGLVGVIGMKSPAYQTSSRNFAMEPAAAFRQRFSFQFGENALTSSSHFPTLT
jgi:hypothetical protein